MISMNYRQMGLILGAAAMLVSCGKNSPLGGGDGGLPNLPSNPLLDKLAEQCGIDVKCSAGGIAKGNASISGVASIDAFFQSVLDFQLKANNVSAAIDAQLTAIRGDFGIKAGADLKAELSAQVKANLEAGLSVKAEPAQCSVDAKATLEAQAHCDASVDPGSAMVECSGSCEVDATAKVDCGASADLVCTVTPPMGMCSGTCKGSCEAKLSGKAKCDGVCKGTCDGTCSAYSDSAGTMCAGNCSGMCTGSCDVQLMAEAKCDGTCSGECNITPPSGMCTGGASAHCNAKAGAMVQCKGTCKGDIKPPSAKAECNASAKAEAKLNVQCTPPRVAINYTLKAGVDAMAQAKFEAGLKNLQVRLPALLAAVAQAKAVADAGVGLTGEGKAAMSGAISTASKAAGMGNLRVLFGLKCALGELDAVGGAIGGATTGLTASIKGAADLSGALGL
jgi:hypothetical protein